MSSIVKIQLIKLCIFFATGLAIGILFDIFRILRKSFKTSNLITYLEDISFGILSFIIFIIVLLKYNNGEIRNYVIIGLLLGITLYICTISEYFIKINVFLISFFKKIIYIPYLFVLKVLKFFMKPFRFIIINIYKTKKIFCKKMLKLKIKPIKFKKKHIERRILKVNVEKYK